STCGRNLSWRRSGMPAAGRWRRPGCRPRTAKACRSSPGSPGNPGPRSHVRHHLGREEPEVVAVVDVQRLEVHALRAQRGVPTDLLDHLVRRAGDRVGTQVLRGAADELGTTAYLRLVGAAADRVRVRVRQTVGIASDPLTRR